MRLALLASLLGVCVGLAGCGGSSPRGLASARRDAEVLARAGTPAQPPAAAVTRVRAPATVTPAHVPATVTPVHVPATVTPAHLPAKVTSAQPPAQATGTPRVARPARRARGGAGRVAGRSPARGDGRAAAATGAPPQTGVPLARLLAAAPALDRALASSPTGGAAPRSLAAAATAGALLSAASRAGAHVGSIVQVRPDQFVVVHASAGGPVVEMLPYRTDSGDQERAFTVYAVSGTRWLGVSVPALGGHLGWILADPARVVVEPAWYEIRVSLARRELWLLKDGRVQLRTLVVIGAAGTPTPPGQFSVDDKLRFTPASPAYGIGVLALSVAPHGLNWRLWRVAIHGLNNLGQVGGTGSLGCVHVPTKALAKLLARVPVGTPVDIQA